VIAKTGMKAFRITIVVILAVCALPIAVFIAAWATSAASGCALQFEEPHVCALSAMDIGWLLDALVRIGVWGALTFGLGVYVFAGWVMIELAAIVLRTFRRG